MPSNRFSFARALRTSLGLILLVAAIGEARAELLTFTDSAAFEAARGSVALVTEDFSSATVGALSKGTPIDFGGFTAQADDQPGNDMVFYIAPDPFSGAQHAPFTSSQHLGWAENPSGLGDGNGAFGPTITITFDTAQTAVSFLFLDSDGTDEYRLAVDGTTVASFPSSGTSFDGAFFFGVVDTASSFTTLTFSTVTTNPGGTVEEFGIDDIRFSVTAVPEPSSFALLALGGGFVAFARRRTRRVTKSA